MPTDRRATAAAELEPVFADLAPVVADCRALRAAATAAADREQAEAVERATAIVSQARAEAEAERVATAARSRHRAAAEARRLTDEAAAQADEVRQLAGRRRPELVARVLGRVRAELSELSGNDR